jgi:hypothetical protein
MTQTIINLGTGGAALNGQNGSTTSADSNDALFLDWDGLNYVYLPGVASNFLSVPDEAALDITGDIDIRVQVSLESFSGFQTFISKGSVATTLNYRFLIGNDELYFSFGDGAQRTAISNAALSTVATVGQTIWLRVTRAFAADEVRFFTSSDAVTWSQLGDFRTIGVFTPLTNASDVTIGLRGTGSDVLSAKVYRAQIYSDLTETNKILDVDTSVITSGAATSFTALTGQTVTINRSTAGRKSVAVVSPVWLFGTDDQFRVPFSNLYQFNGTDQFTVLTMLRIPSLTNNQGIIATRNSVSSTQGPVGWVHRTLDGPDRLWTIHDDGTATSTRAENYTVGNFVVSGFIVTATQIQTVLNSILGAINRTGSTANNLGLRIGSNAANGSFADMELFAVAIFRRALTASEITQISDYYQARLS